MDHYFDFNGFNLENALQNALDELQVLRKDIRYKILTEDDEGCTVRVYIKEEQNNNFKKKRRYDNNQGVFLSLDKLEHQEIQFQKIIEFIKGLLLHLEVQLEGFYIEIQDNNMTYINLSCNEPALVIGKQGAGLLSIQAIINSYANQLSKDLEHLELAHFSVTIDIQGYYKRRLESIKNIVYETIKKVTSSQQSIILEGEYNPMERKYIHCYVKTFPGVETESQGNSFLKTILIKAI